MVQMQVEALLGPKTEEDLKPVEKKKAPKPAAPAAAAATATASPAKVSRQVCSTVGRGRDAGRFLASLSGTKGC
jgi:hypothetical protein